MDLMLWRDVYILLALVSPCVFRDNMNPCFKELPKQCKNNNRIKIQCPVHPEFLLHFCSNLVGNVELWIEFKQGSVRRRHAF